MQDKKRKLLDILKKQGIYLVTGPDSFHGLSSCIDAGTDIIQYRDKEAD